MATEMEVTLPVLGWKAGDEIVIASTSKSMRENEVVHIVSISGDGKTIQFEPSLKYKHIALTQTIEGRVIETAAEVRLLIHWFSFHWVSFSSHMLVKVNSLEKVTVALEAIT